MARAFQIACAAVSCAVLCGGPRAAGADDPAPAVIFDVGSGAGGKLEGQGVKVVTADSEGRPAGLLSIDGGTAWARIFVRRLTLDVKPFQHLDLDLRLAAGEGQELKAQLLDAGDREATLRLDAPKAAWETRRLDLGDFQLDPGFDPARVTTFLLVWMKPLAQTVAVGKAVLVAGPAGWRHPPAELAKRVFGPQRAREVKNESTTHFDLWSDDARAMKAVGASLEQDAEACALILAAPKDGLSGFKIPAYVFKQASDYQEYCARALGWTKEQARRTPAAGSDRGLVFYVKGVADAQLRHRLGKAVFAHLYGDGGGAWLQDGAGEYCVRRLLDRPTAKEFAPRVKTGEHWSMEDLLRAASLHGGERTDQSFDYRPIYLYSASVVEFLLREAPPAANGSDSAPSERITARLKALGALRSAGKDRLAELPAALGLPIADFEAAFKAWVPKAK